MSSSPASADSPPLPPPPRPRNRDLPTPRISYDTDLWSRTLIRPQPSQTAMSSITSIFSRPPSTELAYGGVNLRYPSTRGLPARGAGAAHDPLNQGPPPSINTSSARESALQITTSPADPDVAVIHITDGSTTAGSPEVSSIGEPLPMDRMHEENSSLLRRLEVLQAAGLSDPALLDRALGIVENDSLTTLGRRLDTQQATSASGLVQLTAQRLERMRSLLVTVGELVRSIRESLEQHGQLPDVNDLDALVGHAQDIRQTGQQARDLSTRIGSGPPRVTRNASSILMQVRALGVQEGRRSSTTQSSVASLPLTGFSSPRQSLLLGSSVLFQEPITYEGGADGRNTGQSERTSSPSYRLLRQINDQGQEVVRIIPTLLAVDEGILSSEPSAIVVDDAIPRRLVPSRRPLQRTAQHSPNSRNQSSMSDFSSLSSLGSGMDLDTIGAFLNPAPSTSPESVLLELQLQRQRSHMQSPVMGTNVDSTFESQHRSPSTGRHILTRRAVVMPAPATAASINTSQESNLSPPTVVTAENSSMSGTQLRTSHSSTEQIVLPKMPPDVSPGLEPSVLPTPLENMQLSPKESRQVRLAANIYPDASFAGR